MKIVEEFRAFALRGNVVDLAVGVIIGAAFNSVVQSVVNDLFSPVLGLLVGGADFSALSFTLRPAVGEAEAVLWRYGAFINALISFLITAWAVFLMVKGMNSLSRKQAVEPTPPPAPSTTDALLGEIRDLLARPSRTTTE
ncbi:MAG: large-conductance mechanosensitive channel protein MscL [Hyphomonadaceae bacterium]|nr:large-conductance mechanosensitive channel protein MscL [Hyphomonadaceae bacterium]